MDFTDLIDWGKSSRFSYPPQTPTTSSSLPLCFMRLLDLLQFIAPEVFIISNEMHSGCISFPRAKSEKLKHSWKWLIAMYLTENKSFLAHDSQVHESNPACTDRVYRDNWQIPGWNEMLCILKVTSVFAFCLEKESQHFDVLPRPCTKNTFFLSGAFLPNFPGNSGTLGNWFDPWHVNISFGESIKIYQEKKEGTWNVSNETAAIKSFMVLEYLSSKWDISVPHKSQEN